VRAGKTYDVNPTTLDRTTTTNDAPERFEEITPENVK
jgi:hypothetical protein